ncbi:hypothetical protein SAMN02745246_02422 [Leeuwenhoekiella marinoflava DSM 3653]|uniref:Uncharacterized protein n=2 Tax=Leeuwenhoekiella marinoflava TaxID=988 RepID=A0A4V1KS17_9FLAO|nr:hypothetical protein DSL99_3219 [Leeuwenhoekiella marinoflava]SHF40881.1 hypothetical protein SAMN02745246_02422 [Leeuwenhoekiella marinoflava DSM 3653]
MKEVSFDFEGLRVYQKALDFIHRVRYYGSRYTCFRLWPQSSTRTDSRGTSN